MSTVHQQFKVSLDHKPYEAGLSKVENATKASTARTAREFDKVQSASNRVNANAGRMSGRAGQASMQVQDIAVQMQMGARYSTIIAQQGSQLASIFGPGGMILGGVVAIGAALWENKQRQSELVQSAQDEARVRERTAQITRSQQAARADDAVVKEIESMKLVARVGEKDAKIHERRLKLKEDIAKIDAGNLPGKFKTEAKANLIEKARLQGVAELNAGRRGRSEESIMGTGKGILDRARQSMLPLAARAEARRAERSENRAIRSTIGKDLDFEDRQKRNNSRMPTKGDNRPMGMSGKERDQQMQARREAAQIAKKPEALVKFSDGEIEKLAAAILKLIPA